MNLENTPSQEQVENNKKPTIRRTYIPEDPPIALAVKMLNDLNDPEGRLLRPAQRRVHAKVIETLLEKPDFNGYLDLPTGFGKTYQSIALLKSIDRDAVVLVPTEVIMNQYIQTFSELMALTPIEIPTLLASATFLTLGEDENGDVSISNRQRAQYVGTLYRYRTQTGKTIFLTTHAAFITNRNFLNELDESSQKILVVDEAHRFIGPESSKLIHKYTKDKNYSVIGLSATPDYADEDPEHNLGGKFGECIYRVTVQEAVDNEDIAPFEVLDISVGIPRDTSVIDKNTVATRGAQINIPEINAELHRDTLLAILRAPPWMNKKIIVSFSTLERAKTVAEMLNSDSIGEAGRAFYISGEMNKKMIKDILEQFVLCPNGVLIGAQMVKLGLNIPDADTAIIVGDTESGSSVAQAAGRALRYTPDGRIKQVMHIHSPIIRTKNKYGGADTVKKRAGFTTYWEVLNQTGHIDQQPMNKPYGPFPAISVENRFRGGRDAPPVSIMKVGEVSKRTQTVDDGITEYDSPPIGFVKFQEVVPGRLLAHVRPKHFVMLGLALQSFSKSTIENHMRILCTKQLNASSKEWGIWIDSELRDKILDLENELETIGKSSEFVTIEKIARQKGVKIETIERLFIRRKTDFPELEHIRLGITQRIETETIQGDKSKTTAGGEHICWHYPATILSNPLIRERKIHFDKQSESGTQIWYSLQDLRDRLHPKVGSEFPRTRFLRYINDLPISEQQLLIQSGTPRIGSAIESTVTYYHTSLIERFLHEEATENIRPGYYTATGVNIAFGIPSPLVSEYLASRGINLTNGGSDYVLFRVNHHLVPCLSRKLTAELVRDILHKREVIHRDYVKNVVILFLENDGEHIDNDALLQIWEKYCNETYFSKLKKLTVSKTRYEPSVIDTIIQAYKSKSTALHHTPLSSVDKTNK